MIQMRYVELSDIKSWMKLDSHLSTSEFTNKVKSKMGYVLTLDKKVIGILRYNLFWDNIPFCTLLFIDPTFQLRGYGRRLLKHWEDDMKSKEYGTLLTSIQVDESSQLFLSKARI